MLIEEAKWIGETLSNLNLRSEQTVLDIGSCSEYYRCVDQGYIDYFIFRPLRLKGLHTTHVDGRAAVGVDIVCDISSATPPDVFKTIPHADVVIAANLLEHVKDREKTIQNLVDLTKPGGYLLVTVPCQFPYHPYPIDTLYRPTPEQLAEVFDSRILRVEKKCKIQSPYRITEAAKLITLCNKIMRKVCLKQRLVLVNDGPFTMSCILLHKI